MTTGEGLSYLGTSKPIVCFFPETVMRATFGKTSESSLLWEASLLLAEKNKRHKKANKGLHDSHFLQGEKVFPFVFISTVVAYI